MEASTLRISDRHNLVATVPYLLGFHPEHSLVVLVLSGKRLVVTGRVDLPEPEEFDQVPELVRSMIEANGGDSAVIIVFAARPHYPADWLLAACLDDPCGSRVRDALLVSDGRWRSLLDDEEDACETAAPAAAAAVMQGMVALPSRDDVGRLATPSSEGDSAVHDAALLRLARDHPRDDDRFARMGELLDADLPSPDLTSPDLTKPGVAAGGELFDLDRAAELALLAGTAAGRAAALGRLDRDNASSAVRLWSTVVRCTPASWAVGPLCLLGLAAWVDGDGALQLICAERALALDPGDGLAEDLLELNTAMVPPSAWDRTRVRRRENRLPRLAIDRARARHSEVD